MTLETEDALDAADELDFSADAETDLSREFLLLQAQGVDPSCHRPWRVLKVDVHQKTKVCCDFFTQLPVFEFPTARDFHSEGGMWNHPFMQHMRRTMRTTEEVPFCTLCLTSDKRSPQHAERRAEAKRDSLAIFQRMDGAVRRNNYRGSIEDHNSILANFEFTLPDGQVKRPFRGDKDFYRRLVHAQGFVRRRRVLLFGCASVALAPFLAESCESLTLADPSPGILEQARILCERFDLPTTAATFTKSGDLDLADETFDAVWANGETFLSRSRLIPPLSELSRVLEAGGSLHVRRGPAAGAVFKRLNMETNPKFADRWTALLRGNTEAPRLGLMFATRDLRSKLRQSGLRLDVSPPVATTWTAIDATTAATCPDKLSDFETLVAKYRSTALEGDWAGKLEEHISFSASKPIGVDPRPQPQDLG